MAGGSFDEQTVTITINGTSDNVAPTVQAGPDITIDEGETFTRSGSFTDPDIDTWTATVDYGDGTGVHPLHLNADHSFGLAHQYTDNGAFTVTVSVTDPEGAVDTDTLQVTVDNVAPVAFLTGGDTTIDEGHEFSASGVFIDPGADTWTATVDYGDGTGVQQLALTAEKTFELSHLYADDGDYTVTVTVSDDDLASGTTSSLVHVNDVAVVPGVRVVDRTLSIVGSDARDIIDSRRTSNGSEIKVDLRLDRDGADVRIRETFADSDVDQIVVQARDGDDWGAGD